jgi:hypothetical protein
MIDAIKHIGLMAFRDARYPFRECIIDVERT